MKRILACVLGFLLFSSMAVSAAEGPSTEEEVTLLVRSTLAAESDPERAAQALAGLGVRTLGFQERTVTFTFDGKEVKALPAGGRSMGPDLVLVRIGPAAEAGPGGKVTDHPARDPGAVTGESDASVLAGNKADLTITLWVFETRCPDGSYREQAVITGHWSSTEYSWIDNPADVIDVRWIVGDLVYLSSSPFDGVQRDQHTHGIASFTVDDQVADWDLFVFFRPVSGAVHGRWTNIFANYTHSWWGTRLTVQLGAGPNGSTGNITINTDASTWIEGTGVGFEIGSGQTSGPGTTGRTQ